VCVCVCACACVRVCVSVFVCVCAHARGALPREDGKEKDFDLFVFNDTVKQKESICIR
jgi:hypothetical protein